jgi:hypothetical protein
VWFPALADCNPLYLSYAPDDLRKTFHNAQRSIFLKCLQNQDDKYSLGYVMCKGDWVTNRKLILQLFDTLTLTISMWMKPLSVDLEDLLDWDEYLNGNNFKVDASVFQFLHSRLLATFADYDSGKLPAPPARKNFNADCRRGTTMCVHTCGLEVVRKMYNKTFGNQEEETSNIKKRKANFKKDKVTMSTKKLQEKEDEMGISDD